MTPEMMVRITAKNQTQAGFSQVVSDANRAAAAVNDNGARMAMGMNDAGFATANLAAQFNDIGVMLASGQSPLLLAVQQGTQISQVLGPMKAGAAVAALRTALMSLLSPVTLITVGSIAAGAALVQWLMSTNDIETATEAFERHRKQLDEIVTGYANAQTAVDAYFAAIGRMPRSIATSELNAAFQDMGASVEDFRARMEAFANDGHWAKYGSEAVRSMQELAGAFSRGELTAEEFHSALESVRDQLNPIERLMAFAAGSTNRMIDAFQEGALTSNQFANALANVVAQSHALAGLSGSADLTDFISSHADGVADAIETLKGVTPELRSIQQIIQDTYAEGMSDPLITGAGREALTSARDAAIAAVAEADARRTAAKAATVQANAYADVIGGLETELQMLGLSAREQEVLNNIRAAGVSATSQQGLAIRELTEDLYDQKAAVEAYEKAQQAANRELERLGQVGVSAIDSLAGAFDDGVLSGQELLGIVRSLGKQLAQIDWGAMFSGFGGGGGNWLSMLFGGGKPALKLGYNLPGYANGTDAFPGGWARINEEGGEIVNLPKGSQIVPHDLSKQLVRSASAERKVEVHVHQDASHQGPPEASVSSSGNVDIVRVIVGTVAQAFGEGRLDGVMAGNFGLKRKPSF